MTLKVTEEELAVLIDKTGKGQRVTAPPVTKPSKYHNVKVEVDGFQFDSKREATRYRELKLQQQAGQITSLTIHTLLPLTIHGEHIADYEADFYYIKDGKWVIEDVKGHETEVYKLKKKLVEVLYKQPIIEIRKRR